MTARLSRVACLLVGFLCSFAHAGPVPADQNPGDPAAVSTGASNDDDFIGGAVTRAVFTRNVVNREPVDNLDSVPGNLNFLYYFTELKGFTGAVVTHRWEHEGRVVDETRFQVGGPRWRVWSSRPLPPDQIGQWRVSVLDIQGRVVTVSDFVFGATASAPR